ncbi:DUF2235 domain-containing protein [Chromobacterium violaceum]|uniref:T6SS phospholipase effector Tle1-like catalytic domain-containing protein n=1 Tax=Chromobacterium violaceum TaxID=536 RepID=UPI0035A65482
MSARFSELCKQKPLELQVNEAFLAEKNRDIPSCLQCQQDIFIGFFFDGTNNNKYRDTPQFSNSNVARLYEVYAGTPTTPLLQLGSIGSPTPDQKPAWPGSIGAEARPYYRKTYVPGVGTPFIELGDTGDGTDATLGLAMAKHGEARLDWALLQVGNQIAAALTGNLLSPPLKSDPKTASKLQVAPEMVRATIRAQLHAERAEELKKTIARRMQNKPTPRKVRLSVFGFSRGAAEARVFCNWVMQYLGSQYGGLPLVIDFLGIFDTVASVGLAQSVPFQDGHYAWATPDNLAIHPAIKRCVHLVAAHEVRGSFPLDSAPGANVKEVVYPGMHSDVGGGYTPNDQGRSIGVGAAGDAKKLSQIPLAQMYREALIAGVPLLKASDMLDVRKNMFNIDAATIQAFNAYIDATRHGNGKPDANLWLTETQPPEPVKQIIHRHYGIFLRWRKSMLGKVHTLPGLRQSADPAAKKTQDIHDFQLTDQHLRDELAMLDTPYPPSATATLLSGKVVDWQNGVSQAWHDTTPVKPAEKVLFETLVHDSRAWFKPLGSGDSVPQLQQYQAERIQELENKQRSLAAQQKALKNSSSAQLSYPPVGVRLQALDQEFQKNQQRLDALKQGKSYVIADGGHEFYFQWGYLRWRTIYAGEHPAVKAQRTKQQLKKLASKIESAIGL